MIGFLKRTFPRLRSHLPGVVLVAACLGLASGCGSDGPPRYDLSGKVTFDGKPIPAGTIVFQPDASAGNSGPQGTAEIRDGEFDTASGGKGTAGGAQIVRIRGLDHLAENENDPVKELFPEYELKADVPKNNGTMDFEVPADAAKPRSTRVPMGGA